MPTHLYLDAEWYGDGRIYLLGYAYSLSTYSYLTLPYVTWHNVADIIAPVDGVVFCYGPDIGIIKNHTALDIGRFRPVVNLLGVIKQVMPGLPDYKLATVEYYLGLKRSTGGYKSNPADISRHFNKGGRSRKTVIRYNREDVLNLIRIKRALRLPYCKWLKFAK